MKHDSVVELKKKEPFIDDAITDILRTGARQLLAQALEAEIALFICQFADMRDEQGRQRIVRNGCCREREIQSGIGPVPVKAPRARDRVADPSERIAFQSALLPPYLPSVPMKVRHRPLAKLLN